MIVFVPILVLAIVNNLFWVSNFESIFLLVLQQFILGYAIVALFLLTRWGWTPLQFYHPILIIAVAWFLRENLAQTGVALSFMIVSQVFFNLRKHLRKQCWFWHLALMFAATLVVSQMSASLQVGSPIPSFGLAQWIAFLPFVTFVILLQRFGPKFDSPMFFEKEEAR